MRTPLLSQRRADASRADPHGSEAVPVPGVRALVQPQRPPDDAPAHPHRRKAVRVRRVRAPVRAERRTKASFQDPREGAQRRRRRVAVLRWRSRTVQRSTREQTRSRRQNIICDDSHVTSFPPTSCIAHELNGIGLSLTPTDGCASVLLQLVRYRKLFITKNLPEQTLGQSWLDMARVHQ